MTWHILYKYYLFKEINNTINIISEKSFYSDIVGEEIFNEMQFLISINYIFNWALF